MSNKLDKIFPIGAKIWQAAENQGYKKQDFAKKMNVSRGTLDNWIKDITSPSYEEVELASKILGVQISQGQQRSFRDEIFEGDYIGLHKRVWTQIENSMNHDREIMKTLAQALADAAKKR